MLYSSVGLCKTLYDSVQLCTTLYNSVQLRTTLYDSVQLCTTLYNSVQLCIFEIRPFIRETLEAGSCLSLSISKKKRDEDEKSYTFSCNVRNVLGNTATNKGVYILSSRVLLLQKIILLKSQEIFPDLCQCLSLNNAIYLGPRNLYIILSILLN